MSATTTIPVEQWRKSSYSGTHGEHQCVEVAALPGTVGVRDSTDPQGGRLWLSARDWDALLARLKDAG